MKKELSPAKPPLPKFQSDQEAAEYFESHSVAGLWDQLPEAAQAKALPALERKIRDRHARAKSPISLRVPPAPEKHPGGNELGGERVVGFRAPPREGIGEGSRPRANPPRAPAP